MLFEMSRHVETSVSFSLSPVSSHTVGPEAYVGHPVEGCNEVARWPLFQNKWSTWAAGLLQRNEYSKRYFGGGALDSLCGAFFINELNLGLGSFIFNTSVLIMNYSYSHLVNSGFIIFNFYLLINETLTFSAAFCPGCRMGQGGTL